MKRMGLALLACMAGLAGSAQPATVALEDKNQTPQERFLLMKSNSETYQDYKVIKENILNGVWKTGLDSLTKRERQLQEAITKINALENEVSLVRAEIKSKESSMSEIVFAGTHINVLGIDLPKGVFLMMNFVGMAILVGAIFFVMARMKVMRLQVKENRVMVASLENEFKEYKRTAMDKHIKIARELQTERNKLVELKGS